MTSNRWPFGILEVETTPAPTGVDLSVGVVVGCAAVGKPFGLHPAEDFFEFRLADMEGVVMAGRGPGGSGWSAKSKVRLSLTCTCAKLAFARLNCQAEDVGKERG